MTTYFNRTPAEQGIIRKAYDFEVEAISEGTSEMNSYFNTIMSMTDGPEVWETLNEAIKLAFQ